LQIPFFKCLEGYANLGHQRSISRWLYVKSPQCVEWCKVTEALIEDLLLQNRT